MKKGAAGRLMKLVRAKAASPKEEVVDPNGKYRCLLAIGKGSLRDSPVAIRLLLATELGIPA